MPRRYMYLPPLPGEDKAQEWLVDLSRTDTIAIGLLSRQMNRRLEQLTFVAALQLLHPSRISSDSRPLVYRSGRFAPRHGSSL